MELYWYKGAKGVQPIYKIFTSRLNYRQQNQDYQNNWYYVLKQCNHDNKTNCQWWCQNLLLSFKSAIVFFLPKGPQNGEGDESYNFSFAAEALPGKKFSWDVVIHDPRQTQKTKDSVPEMLWDCTAKKQVIASFKTIFIKETSVYNSDPSFH